MFLKVELTLILHGFGLFCVRRECEDDRCPSRKCNKYALCVKPNIGFSFVLAYINLFWFVVYIASYIFYSCSFLNSLLLFEMICCGVRGAKIA